MPGPASPSSGTSGATSTETSGRGTIALFVAVGTFVLAAMVLVVLSTDPGTNTTTASAAPTEVALSEFKIAPVSITATAGSAKLHITNNGSQAHNVTIAKLGQKSPDIAPGKSATLDLSSAAAGTYEVVCSIPGHADSGMKATLVIGAEGSGPATATAAASGDASMAGMDMSGDPSPDYAAMDAAMNAGMKAGLDTFVKGNATKGVGNQPLKPTIEADGTKVFGLEASIIDWEVSPGKTVKAWAYNGMVPGPWIRTEPNDHVKVVIKNSLPVGTDIHFHGITTPFPDDGVSPLTQPPIEPGQTYTYEWTNSSHPELGMYHAHDHGQVAVLNGMFAVFQVGDVVLPAGRTISGVALPANLKPTQELPMVLNDAGVIGLTLNGKGYPATAPVVTDPGDVVLVHYYNEGLLSHPMHLHHLLQLVVAKDGVYLDQPYWADTINVAPGERYSVLILPTANDIGVWAWHCHILNHAENDNGLYGMVTALIVNDPSKK